MIEKISNFHTVFLPKVHRQAFLYSDFSLCLTFLEYILAIPLLQGALTETLRVRALKVPFEIDVFIVGDFSYLQKLGSRN